MMTKEDAKRAVEAELHSQKLTVVEMTDFRQEMYKRLEFKSDSERLANIRKAVYELAPLGRLGPTR